MFARVTRRLDLLIGRLAAVDPWTNVYGTARSLLALSTLLSLAFTSQEILFTPALDIETVPVCVGLGGSFSLFCVVGDQLWLARWLAIAILIVVISGWRPRITGVLHWWVCFSLVNSVLLIDGGDHVALVLAFLLLPITLTDPRRSHFARRAYAEQTAQSPPASSGEAIRRLVASSSHLAIRFQLAILYLHAAFAKCAVTEWQNGTALYYWLVDPQYGVADWLQPAIFPLLRLPFVVAPMTWAVIAFEFALFAGLLAERRYRPILLCGGLLLHAGIALFHGLISFSLAMSGALVLFLRPLDQEFELPRLTRFPRLMWLARLRATRVTRTPGATGATRAIRVISSLRDSRGNS